MSNIKQSLQESHSASPIFKCEYCGKESPIKDLVKMTIHYQDRNTVKRRLGKYCSIQCGSNDQFAHEG